MYVQILRKSYATFIRVSICPNTEETNFSTGKMKGYTPERSGPPEINYSTGTVYRSSYRSPQGTRDYDGSLPTTRFGSTNSRVPAIGVGELTITICSEAVYTQH